MSIPISWERLHLDHSEYWLDTYTSVLASARATLEQANDAHTARAVAPVALTSLQFAIALLRSEEQHLQSTHAHNKASRSFACHDTTRYAIRQAASIVNNASALLTQSALEFGDRHQVVAWPPLIVGTSGAMRLLSRVLRNIPQPQRELASHSSVRITPIVLQTRSHNYFYDKQVHTAMFPSVDLPRVRMWPLIAHEIGHAMLEDNTREHADKDSMRHAHTMLVECLSTLSQLLPATERVIAVEHLATRQLHELASDVFASIIFGIGYLYSLFVYLGDNAPPSVRHRPLRSAAYVRWLFGKHPPSLVRVLIIVNVLHKRGDLNAQQRQDFVQHITGSDSWTKGHREVLYIIEKALDRMSACLNEAWHGIGVQYRVTDTLYNEALDFLRNPSSHISTKDARSLVIAAALRRLSLVRDDKPIGSFLFQAIDYE